MKESKRKEDFKQLKKQRKILATVTGIMLVIFLIIFLSIALWGHNTSEQSETFLMAALGSIMLYVILGISYFTIDQKIYKKLTKIQKDEIMKRAEDNLKKTFKPKNKTIIQKILGTQIKQIIFRDCTEKELKAEILLSNNSLLYPICFPKEKLLSLIDTEGNDRLLEKIIDSITIDELEDEMVKINIKLIDGETITIDCCYEILIESFESVEIKK